MFSPYNIYFFDYRMMARGLKFLNDSSKKRDCALCRKNEWPNMKNRHKLACQITEGSKKLEIANLRRRGVVLSVKRKRTERC